jgi:TolB-like protein/DNA-binding winged helix-turn-helix (wHTH) protein/Flp pilus assembly protein TadD
VNHLVASGWVTFGEWRFERERLFRLDEAGEWTPASISSRAAGILAALLRTPGELVSKDALMDAVWPGIAVEANNLTVQIAGLRRVLDEGRPESCIQTVPGRGYRFVLPVIQSPDDISPRMSVPAGARPVAPVAIDQPLAEPVATLANGQMPTQPVATPPNGQTPAPPVATPANNQAPVLPAATLPNGQALAPPVTPETNGQTPAQPVASLASGQPPVTPEADDQTVVQPVTPEANSQTPPQPAAAPENEQPPVTPEANNQTTVQPVAAPANDQQLAPPVATPANAQVPAQPVTPETNNQLPAPRATLAANDQRVAGSVRRGWQYAVVGACILALMLMSAVTVAWHSNRPVGPPAPPRLSIVVMPFENLSDNRGEDSLVDGITDDVTTELSQINDVVVTARESAYAYRARPLDVRDIGEKLGVRYLLEGSVRRIGSLLRVNAQLTSTETGANLWSDRFEEQDNGLAAGQEQIVTRMRDELARRMLEIESARSVRERPHSPDAFDLIVRGRLLSVQSPTPQREAEALGLFERALVMDPSSTEAMTWVAYYLIDTRRTAGIWDSYADMERAGKLLTQAHEIAPSSPMVLNNVVYWLRTVGRCPEVIEAAQRAIQMDPHRMRVMTGIYNELAMCKTWSGHAEEEIALQEQANQLNPRSSAMFMRYLHLGRASLLLGRDEDAIGYLQRSLAIDPHGDSSGYTDRLLAVAFARTGRMEEAARALSEADRIWPFATVRGYSPDGSPSPVYSEQIRRFQAGLRLAGERDHADADADFHVPPDGVLHRGLSGFTPTSAPGVKTIGTGDLSSLLADARPLVLDTMTYSWGRSVTGAIGLHFAGLGGSFADRAQDRLRDKMRALTGGKLDMPIVAVGWNSESFDGRNLALRLAALGYKDVYWYRGGREAWEVAGQAEATMDVQSW